MQPTTTTLRRISVTLLLITAIVMTASPTKVDVSATSGPQFADDHEAQNKKQKEVKDPCRKALKRAAKGKPLPSDCEPTSSAGVSRGDFNGDGFADLAVGVPFEDEDGFGSVGAVNIVYGSTNGLTSSGDQYLTSLTFGYPYASDDRFGSALASGDFNGDGFSDLAIGMPHRDVGGVQDRGVVLLIDGSASGLATSTARTLIGALGGSALAWGDFNADGFGDLAVGVPERDTVISLCFDHGAVQIFYGGTSAMTRGQTMVGDCNHRYGSPLAAGDFDGDGASDLVIGIPFADRFLLDDFGSVEVWQGGLADLRLARLELAQRLDQDVPFVNGVAEAGDQFGFALAVGDFNADLRDDLAVGVPGDETGTATDAGIVHVFLGGSPFEGELVDSVNDLFFTQGSLGENNESGDRFGRALAAGKFNDDFHADLAIGSPGENVGDISNAGMVSIVFGGSTGLSFTSSQHWH